jgi:hypothetical protein
MLYGLDTDSVIKRPTLKQTGPVSLLLNTYGSSGTCTILITHKINI